MAKWVFNEQENNVKQKEVKNFKKLSFLVVRRRLFFLVFLFMLSEN